MKIEILSEAEQDLIEGYLFYERQMEGLGIYFLDTLFSDINSLQLHAGVHAQHFGFYRLLSKRFPYAIYYQLSEGFVHVHAVLDCRQSPPRVTGRLT